MRILVLNPGSSSLKSSLVELPGDRTLASTTRDWSPGADAADERRAILARTVHELAADGQPPAIDGVGYRVVHGGARFRSATRIDDAVVAEIEALDRLAPLHNLAAAEAIDGARALLDVPHVACFDTAFHATLDEAAWRYPLPADWTDRFGIRRYGFHGLSVTWAVERAAALLGRSADELGLVVAHLGAGCSVTAVDAGRSVDTSMGFTPLEGLMMGTRSGSVDPGIMLHLLREHMPLEDVADGLEHGSGLLGVSGRSADIRELEAGAAAGDRRSALALAMFERRAASAIAGAATALGRFDALVFTGGIGEHAHAVRNAICERLPALGVAPGAPSAGAATGDDAVLSAAGAHVAVLRIAAREDLVIARATAALLTGDDRPVAS